MTATYPDYSTISTYAECMRKGYYAHELQLVPKGGMGIAIHAGRAIHAGLHELYIGEWDVEEAVRAMRSAWGSVLPPPERAYLTVGYAEIILRNYAEDRARESFTPIRVKPDELNHSVIKHFDPSVDDEGYIVFAETPMAIEIAPGFTWSGLIDLPVESHTQLYIVDHKTTGQWLTERWAAQYARSYQLKGYARMVERLLDRPVAGVYINGVYTGAGADVPKAKWSTRTSVRNGLFGPYVFAPEQLDEVQVWATGHAAHVAACRDDAHGLADPALAWPQNDRACDFCQFSDICHSPPATREAQLRMRFTRRELTGILASGADS